MENLLEISGRLIKSVNKKFIRSLYLSINWETRLIEIRGARGVGKTTLMLQRASNLQEKADSILYVSLDNVYFYKNKLTDLCDYFYKYGGKYLFIDEVHKYPKKEKGLDWSQEIKNIYDSYTELNIIYSGSSILQLYKGEGDLSRRKASYQLSGLSFREHLEFNGIIKYPNISLENIFRKHDTIAQEITSSIKILPHFQNYLKFGVYPFYKEAKDKFFDRINNVINVIIETDIPSVSDINFETVLRLKKLFSLLAVSSPFTPNLSKLAAQLFIADYRTLINYLNFLEKAELIKTLSAKPGGDRILNKPDKVFLNNTNLMHGIALENVNKGTERETFLLNQLSYGHQVNHPKQGDFIIDFKYTLEVGGKSKTNKQVANIPDSYIAMDGIETGFGNKIPLWLFGFLY